MILASATYTNVVSLGSIVSILTILTFLGGATAFAWKLMRKLSVIDELPARVEKLSEQLERSALAQSNTATQLTIIAEQSRQWRADSKEWKEQSSEWHDRHLREDHRSIRRER